MNWLNWESPAYWIAFVASFLLVAVWESARPNRECLVPPPRRWSMHGLLLVAVAALNSVIFRLTPVAAAVAAQGSPWGVLGFESIPLPLRALTAFLLLDFTKYATHWLYHHVAFLWPIHRVHHSDPDFDVSTGARFHPLEPLLVQALDLGLILLLAPPPGAVLFSKLTSVLSNFFEHANANLPAWMERVLRTWVVTPGLHRIHHSQGMAEQRRNLGEILPWWDRLLGTYQPEAPGGDGGLVVGLPGYQDTRSVELLEMLTQPFQRERLPVLPLTQGQDPDR